MFWRSFPSGLALTWLIAHSEFSVRLQGVAFDSHHACVNRGSVTWLICILPLSCSKMSWFQRSMVDHGRQKWRKWLQWPRAKRLSGPEREEWRGPTLEHARRDIIAARQNGSLTLGVRQLKLIWLDGLKSCWHLNLWIATLLFSNWGPVLFPNKFTHYLSYRIFGHIHEALNTIEQNN